MPEPGFVSRFEHWQLITCRSDDDRVGLGGSDLQAEEKIGLLGWRGRRGSTRPGRSSDAEDGGDQFI